MKWDKRFVTNTEKRAPKIYCHRRELLEESLKRWKYLHRKTQGTADTANIHLGKLYWCHYSVLELLRRKFIELRAR